MDKINEKMEFLAGEYLWIGGAFLLVQLLLVVFPISFLLATVIFLLHLILFLFLKELMSEKIKKTGFVGFKLAFPLYLMSIASLFGRMLTSVSDKSGVGLLIGLIYFAIIISAIAFFMDKEKKEALDKLYNAKPKGFRLGKSQKGNNGDVQLCLDFETNDPVIIPFKDRFLHMLILGPTGSGKTSQVLLPLIEQDIKNEEYGVTVIEPKGDLAEKVAAMGRYHGKEVIYFNPIHKDCPYFNPLFGPEDEVIENMATTFKMLNPESPQFFQDMNETLIRNSLKLLKRLKGNDATMLDLLALVFNSESRGKIMVNELARMGRSGITTEIAKENAEITSWFTNEYYNPKGKTYEHCSGLRSQISKITSNSHLRRVLNPPNGENDVDFSRIIEEGKILAISTAQGDLRDLGKFLGYFIILNFQSAVFKRPGNENTRRPHFLYIDEFQTYSNPGFADMLTQGRSYRVASHLATQNRALMAMNGGKDGKNFVELVSTNARNVVLFPGGNSTDAKYYSAEFGEELKKTFNRSISRSKFSLFYGFQKMNYPNESIREDEKMGAKFSPSDLIYGNFGEIIYRIVSNNTVQPASKGKVSWLPKEYSKFIDEMVSEYDKKQRISTQEKILSIEPEEDGVEEEIIYPDFVPPPPEKRVEEEREEDDWGDMSFDYHEEELKEDKKKNTDIPAVIDLESDDGDDLI